MSGTYTGGSDGGSASDPYDAISYTIPSQQTITIYVKVGGSVSISGTGGCTKSGVSTLGLSDNTTSITGTVSGTGTMKIDATQPQSGISKHVTVIAVDPGDVAPVISGPSTVDVATTETVTYTATGGDMDSSDWTITSGTTIADIDSYDGGTCVVKLLGGTGTFTIKVVNGAGKSDTKTVTVTDSSTPPTVYISSLSADQSEVYATGGSTTTLTLSYTPTDATSTSVSVSSSGRPPSTTFNIAKQSNGKLRVRITPSVGVSGTYSVYFYTNHDSSVRTGAVTIHIDPGITYVQSIAISGPTIGYVGEHSSYSAAVSPSDADYKQVDWTVSPSSLAEISGSGRGITTGVDFLGPGTVTLKATAIDGSGVSETMTIEVTDSQNPTTALTVTGYDEDLGEGSYRTYVPFLDPSGVSVTVAKTPTDSDQIMTFVQQGVASGFHWTVSGTDESPSRTVTVTCDDPEDILYLIVRSGSQSCTLEFQVEQVDVQSLVVTGAGEPDDNGDYHMEIPINHGAQVSIERIPNNAPAPINITNYHLGDSISYDIDGGEYDAVRVIDMVGTDESVEGVDGYFHVSSNNIGLDIHITVVMVPCTDILLDGVEEGDDHDGYLTVMEESAGTIVATLVPDDCSELLEVTADGDTVVSLEVTADGVEYTVNVTPLSIGTAVLTFTAGQIVKTVEVTVAEYVPVTLNANGGTFPNGMSSVTLECPDRRYVLPDWSVVDRPGRRLSHWLNDGVRGEMGSVQTVGGTWTAQWVTDSRGYDTDFLPHAAVRIYRSLTEYIDATYLQVQGGEVVAELAEMRPGMATMTLLNDYETPGHNLMSSDCDLWSSGADGPIRPGMYVRIDDIQEDGTLEYLMDGFITTIQPDAENVKIEVGDRITFLGKAGSTYRRNFYGESRTEGLFDAGHDTTGLYVDISALPDGFSIDGEVYWDVRATLQKSGSTAQSVISSAGGSCTYTFDVSADRLEDVTLRVGFNGQYALDVYTFSGIVTFSSGGASVTRTIYYEITSTGSVQWHDFDFASLDMDVSGQVTIKIVMEEMGGGRGYCNVYLQRGSGSGTLVYGDTTMQSTDITVSCILGTWAEVTDYGSPSGGKMYVTAIQGQNIEDESLWTPPYGRVRIPYITGSQSVLSIMESMAWALGMTPMPAQTQGADAELVMFRTGGGYALDYYQKLADVASESGRTRCFMVRGYTTPILVPSSRHRLSDTSHGHIHYGGDSVSGGIPFSEFAPSLTMKNRPNLVLVRGTMSEKGETESVPIMVAVEDPDSTEARFGLVVESVTADSQVNRLVDAASSAWATLEENDLDEWEGTVTIPGIRRDMMAVSGAYAGSGEPLRVTDSRNGLSSVQVRARQLRLDYNACTTRITLTNHSIRYSSGIADTTAMAITSADVATGDNSTTLFNTQYVRVKTDSPQTILESGNAVSGKLGSGESFNFGDVSVLQLPSGRSVLVAIAPADGQIHSAADRPYDVVSVAINGGNPIQIRQSVRPDYYDGQTLVLNVDFPTQ